MPKHCFQSQENMRVRVKQSHNFWLDMFWPTSQYRIKIFKLEMPGVKSENKTPAIIHFADFSVIFSREVVCLHSYLPPLTTISKTEMFSMTDVEQIQPSSCFCHNSI